MHRWIRFVSLIALAGLAVPGGAKASPAAKTFVYWDQSERQDAFVDGTSAAKSMIPTWDPNGQMCVFPDGSPHAGQFVTGYNPTIPDQNLGTFPRKDPPVGESLWNADGSFSGKTVYVPGPYKNPGAAPSAPGGDLPPDAGTTHEFNVNGTFTGCAFNAAGDLFAADIGQAQGQFPPPDNGRLIEWFAAVDYTSFCILLGPTSGGVGDHHVDGTGGLRDPGMMTTDSEGNLYVPEAGATDPITGQFPAFGRVLKIDHTSIPASAASCTGSSGMPTTPVSSSVWLQGTPAWQPFPIGIARDPSCNCLAVSNIIGSPAVAWYNDDGTPSVAKGPVPAGDYSPFGLAFTPTGDLYFIDIAVECGAPSSEQVQSGNPINCGPKTLGGNLYRVKFLRGVALPAEVMATGLDYPTSVTTCTTRVHECPEPADS